MLFQQTKTTTPEKLPAFLQTWVSCLTLTAGAPLIGENALAEVIDFIEEEVWKLSRKINSLQFYIRSDKVHSVVVDAALSLQFPSALPSHELSQEVAEYPETRDNSVENRIAQMKYYQDNAVKLKLPPKLFSSYVSRSLAPMRMSSRSLLFLQHALESIVVMFLAEAIDFGRKVHEVHGSDEEWTTLTQLAVRTARSARDSSYLGRRPATIMQPQSSFVFLPAIYEIFHAVHTRSMRLSSAAALQLHELVRFLVASLTRDAVSVLLQFGSASVLSSAEIQAVLRSLLPEGVCSHAVSEATMRVMRFHQARSSPSPLHRGGAPTRSLLAGTQLPVSAVEGVMHEVLARWPQVRPAPTAAIFLGAAVEYLVAELIEVAGHMAALLGHPSQLTLEDFAFGSEDDADYRELLRAVGFRFLCSGVLPAAKRGLMKKTRGRSGGWFGTARKKPVSSSSSAVLVREEPVFLEVYELFVLPEDQEREEDEEEQQSCPRRVLEEGESVFEDLPANILAADQTELAELMASLQEKTRELRDLSQLPPDQPPVATKTVVAIGRAGPAPAPAIPAQPVRWEPPAGPPPAGPPAASTAVGTCGAVVAGEGVGGTTVSFSSSLFSHGGSAIQHGPVSSSSSTASSSVTSVAHGNGIISSAIATASTATRTGPNTSSSSASTTTSSSSFSSSSSSLFSSSAGQP